MLMPIFGREFDLDLVHEQLGYFRCRCRVISRGINLGRVRWVGFIAASRACMIRRLGINGERRT